MNIRYPIYEGVYRILTNIGGVVSVTCKVYITDFTILHFKILHIPSTDKNYAILFD